MRNDFLPDLQLKTKSIIKAVVLLINKVSKVYIKTKEMNNYDHMVKIIIIGDSAVGKSNVLLRFT